ncbi:MAG: DNA repair protein RecN, partial [Deltaproteobacteria bacterium]
GETGAGKSMIIQAVTLLLGGRASADLIRTGEEHAELNAFFDIEAGSPAAAIMEEQGMDWTEGLMITRQIARSGKSRVFINSRSATLELLKSITASLAAIAGQHSHQILLKEENHLDILDDFADTRPLRDEVARLYHEIMPLKKKIQEMEAAKDARIKEAELLRFQADELDDAALVPGEDEALEQQKKQLTSAVRVFETISRTVNDIHDTEGSITEKLSRFRRSMEMHQNAFPVLEEVCQNLDSITCELEDMTHSLRDIAGGIDMDPQSLETVNERLDLLARLKRKYGGDLDSLIETREGIRKALARTENMDQEISRLQASLAELETRICASALSLSEKRKSAATRLGDLARTELASLEMDKAHLSVNFSTVQAVSEQDISLTTGEKIFASGMDRVGFMFSANPGESPRPLHRIASSEKVGKKLQELSDRHQVICITHQAQIAKYGASQFLITKQIEKGRTSTKILPLTNTEDRVAELARMIGGTQISDATLAHAREMLEQA